MLKSILISTVLLGAAATTGIWIKSDGEIIEVPCPQEYDDSRERLPQGCVNLQPGIWLSVDRYRDMEVEIASLKERLEGKDREVQVLEGRVNELQGQLIICTAVPECPSCPSTLPNTVTGAVIGTVITAGGCALWTISQ